ncbi:uncharacterized protein F4822DRAFT_225813 [Hypoxylon trugodes]|uniref:uncharacterized protein n=1 Tax=Hypoxylon trugodes TaxID=326681 RepID=UPI00218E3E2E|nr:uncharacterized protein F4822DRAFT_225813 [Hypoxylon trugodes]KAI1390155.1 hypothetical protein F4822DRAFT_225813 [Hypoxylon trugodes]
MSTTSKLRPLVRLQGMRAAQLPSPTATTEELAPLLYSILREALPFIDSAAPKASSSATSSGADSKIWKSKGVHSHPDSAAKVEVSERVVSVAELRDIVTENKDKIRPETWCCRRSVHEDAPEKGTATWEEFEHCFRDEHAESERAFTPACLAAHQALKWDTAASVPDIEEGGLKWGNFKLVVEEMRHRIGKPILKDRTFPVLQMTSSVVAVRPSSQSTGTGEFVVVSIPVPDFGSDEASKLAKEKGAQIAIYASVERIRQFGGEDGKGKIEWLMATASDAGGILPAWVQNAAAPGVIWKDVPLFLSWIAKEREKSGQKKGGVTNTEVKNTKEENEEVVPQASTGTEVNNVPSTSDGTNDVTAIAAGNPQVSTGIEVGQTARVSASG